MQKKKVLVIGWDACEWKVVNELIEKGLMPTLKKFLEEGTSGKIATMEPPISPMLWTSIATGKRPEHHGITGFTEPDPDPNSKSGVRPVMVTSRKVKAIWNILNQEGCKSNVVGWWPSHPAEPINGCMVSNFYPLSRVVDDSKWVMIDGTVHPPRLHKELASLRVHFNEITGPVLKNFVPKADKIDQEKDRTLFHIANTLGHACSIHTAATFLLETEPWDFMAIYYDTMDHLSHAAMKYHPPRREHIDADKFELYKDVITAGYRFHDMMLERLLEMVDENTTVMILSDHGFHPDHLRPKYIPQEPSGPTYEHSPYGFFAVRGPGIEKNKKIFGGSVIDITPTLLAIYDLPVGKDMAGRVLNDIFSEPKKIKYIDSWENVSGDTGMHSEEKLIDPNAENEAMNQLIELGYVEALSDDKAKNIRITVNETKYNLARGFVHNFRYEEALPLLKELSETNDYELRFSMRLFNCYLHRGKIDEAADLIQKMRDTNAGKFLPGIELNEGLLEMARNNTQKAGELFKRLLAVDPESSSTHTYIGQAYARRYFYQEAETCFRKAISIDKENIFALEGLANMLYKTNRHEEALDFLMNLVETTFYFPRAHALIGEILSDAGYFDKAAESFEVALQMNVNDIKSRKKLVAIYKNHLPNNPNLKLHQAVLEKLVEGEIIVVTGLPRSGMSLIMQMIEKAGITLFYDEAKGKDEFNTNGYFQSSLVKSMSFNRSWMNQVKGKAIRIPGDLIEYLPDKFNYKIIYLHRDFSEILKSAVKTEGKWNDAYLNSFPILLADTFSRYHDILQQSLHSRIDADLLELNYNSILQNPSENADLLAKFLNVQHTEKISEVIINNLHQTKHV